MPGVRETGRGWTDDNRCDGEQREEESRETERQRETPTIGPEEATDEETGEKMLRESSGVKVWVEVRRAAKARLPPAGEAELLASQPCSDTM
ncbi:unnamed protein product [Camellia sinensis]